MVLSVRVFRPEDEAAVVALWRHAGLTRPWNDPHADIARKLRILPELFLVGELEGEIVVTAMGGYDGHRGSVYYLAVDAQHRGRGFARAIMGELERALLALGCPKLNLLVRLDNERAVGFYERTGYQPDAVRVLGKRLIADVP